MSIEVVSEVTEQLVVGVGRLVRQLSSSSAAPGRDLLDSIVGGAATSLLVARHEALAHPGAGAADADADGPTGTTGSEAPVVGMLTLALFPIPTGMRAWIEDVVVDESMRGQGIGEALTMRAVALAAEAGARTVELTSRPSREAANRLYRRLGFQPRETNVYRFQAQQG